MTTKWRTDKAKWYWLLFARWSSTHIPAFATDEFYFGGNGEQFSEVLIFKISFHIVNDMAIVECNANERLQFSNSCSFDYYWKDLDWIQPMLVVDLVEFTMHFLLNDDVQISSIIFHKYLNSFFTYVDYINVTLHYLHS